MDRQAISGRCENAEAPDTALSEEHVLQTITDDGGIVKPELGEAQEEGSDVASIAHFVLGQLAVMISAAQQAGLVSVVQSLTAARVEAEALLRKFPQNP